MTNTLAPLTLTAPPMFTPYLKGAALSTGTVHVANYYGGSALQAVCGMAFNTNRRTRPLREVGSDIPVTCQKCRKHHLGRVAPVAPPAPVIPADTIPCGNADAEHPGYPCRHRASDALPGGAA